MSGFVFVCVTYTIKHNQLFLFKINVCIIEMSHFKCLVSVSGSGNSDKTMAIQEALERIERVPDPNQYCHHSFSKCQPYCLHSIADEIDSGLNCNREHTSFINTTV